MTMNKKINRPFIKKWVEALRSGEYRQTRGCLHDHKGYCCLGVACDLYGKETGQDWNPSKHNECLGFEDEFEVLPETVAQFIFGDSIGSRENPRLRGHTSAADLNDEGTGFAEIADLIETKFLKKRVK